MSPSSQAVDAAVQGAAGSAEKLEAVKSYIMHHVANSDRWHLPGLFDLEFQLPTFSLHALMLLIAAGVLFYLFRVVYRHDQEVPTGMTNLLEIFVLFIRDDIAVTFLGEEDGRKMTPLFCSFFFFILTLNLMGLVPVFAAATGNINVTAALACVSFAFMTFGAIYKNGPAASPRPSSPTACLGRS